LVDPILLALLDSVFVERLVAPVPVVRHRGDVVKKLLISHSIALLPIKQIKWIKRRLIIFISIAFTPCPCFINMSRIFINLRKKFTS
jgi:hypothetical protein